MGKFNEEAVGTSSQVYTSEVESTSSNNKFWHYIKLASDRLDQFGVEQRGIERVEPWERATNKRKQFISVIGLWLSACGGLSSMSSFYLGPLLFGLGLKNSMIPGLVGMSLGCVVAAYFSLMGPRSGCRQMVGARFLFGWYSVRLVSVFGVVGVMGWSIVNSVVGGQILSSISGGKVPLVVGIIIVMVVSLLVSVCGIKQLIRVEAYLALPVNFAFLMLYVVSSQKYEYLSNADAPHVANDPASVKGNWLSFFALCYSITSTWGTIASDYYILFPENTPDTTVFLITLLGIWVPTTFVGVVGLLIGNVALTYQPWGDAYAEYGMGGLLHAAFAPWKGGGSFLLVVIFLSLISNNVINLYSSALGAQLWFKIFGKIPRWLWSIVSFGVCLVCALVGRNEFATILGNFLPMIGYWSSMYFIMLLEENTIFRTRKFRHLFRYEFPVDGDDAQLDEKHFVATRDVRVQQNYNWSIWNDPSRLTHGIAATAGFLAGVAAAALAMSQTYWVGPVAKAVGGEYGGDIATWLCMGFSGVIYPPLRYWELKKFGR
ncbi:vitamin B6 transporter Tpn1p [Diutina catenulata]